MAWYKTGTVAVAATKVTGTGTNFLDAKFGVGPGQAFLLPASGTVKIYEIASVEDATHLTLTTSAGTVAAGAAYAVMSFYTDSIPDFSKRLAAQLGYYQSQMDGWQQIMTGSGTIAITAPDGTVVNISSFNQLTTDIANALRSIPGYTTDCNTAVAQGIFSASASTLNTPPFITVGGWLVVILHTAAGNILQIYHTATTSTAQRNRRHIRTGSVSSGVTTWSDWECISGAINSTAATDLNTLTTNGKYFGSFTNGPVAATGLVEVANNGGTGTVMQSFRAIAANVTYTRSYTGGAWTNWASLIGTNSTLPVASGGTGATTAAAARTALGAAPLVSPTFTGNVQVDQQGNNPAGPTGVSWNLYLISATATGISINTNVDTTDSAQRQVMRVQSIGGRKVFLEVNGGIRCRQGVDAVGANPNNAFNINWATSFAQLWVDGSNVGNISLASTSDVLLKKDVVYKTQDEGYAESCLNEVMGWGIASFKYKSRGVVPESDTKLGFIANQLITKSPECVTGKGLSEGYDELNPDDPYTLDNVAMIAKLTGALHAQQHQIDELKKQIASLQDSSAPTS